MELTVGGFKRQGEYALHYIILPRFNIDYGVGALQILKWRIMVAQYDSGGFPSVKAL